MKCPLLAVGYLSIGDKKTNEKSGCLKENCAWWEQELNLCAVKELALELRYTQLRLAEIFDRMKGG